MFAVGYFLIRQYTPIKQKFPDQDVLDKSMIFL